MAGSIATNMSSTSYTLDRSPPKAKVYKDLIKIENERKFRVILHVSFFGDN